MRGDRPHPNELSGSDLDGDLYLVLWDQDLVPKVPNRPAGDYTPPPQDQSTASVEEEFMDRNLPSRREKILDIMELLEEKDFFIDYISNDCLGTIANSHILFPSYEIFSSLLWCCLLALTHPSVLISWHGQTVMAWNL